MYPIWLSSAPCLEHSGDINYYLLVDPSCTDESCKDETCVCGYACPKFICWALWRTLMRRSFMFVCSQQAIWGSSASYLEHSGDISCSLLVDVLGRTKHVYI